jgi:peptide deformylase
MPSDAIAPPSNEIDNYSILPLGHPFLRHALPLVSDWKDPALARAVHAMRGILATFRRRHGFGRGIAANQIGLAFRMVVVNLGAGAQVLINPKLSQVSERTLTLWDDCMCFPDLLVRVRRHAQVTVEFHDENGQPGQWALDKFDEAELLQHELDHLDGVLAVDRVEGSNPIVRRIAYRAMPEYFMGQVDWTSHARSL